jgi:retinol dehydrogenase-12
MAARSEEKATAAMEDLKKETGKTDIHYLHLDLADLTGIKKSVEDFTS